MTTLDDIFDPTGAGDDGFHDDGFDASVERAAQAELRYGPNEDDPEVTAPYVDILPEETLLEEVSPVDFGHPEEIDLQIEEAMRMGLWDHRIFHKDVPVLPYPFDIDPFDGDGQLD